MKAVFVEMPVFERYRKDYLDDEEFRALQNEMMTDPLSGDVIKGTGGLRKLRWTDKRRNKGKRGGTRIIYYYWVGGLEFWLFTLYDKNEMSDLTADQCTSLAKLLRQELIERSSR